MEVAKAYSIENVKIEKQLIKSIANSLAEEMAREMYYKLLLLKFLPEIKAVEEGRLKTLKGKDIEKFLNSLIKSK
jgi:CRISPR/Cas system-associated protein Cas5 (RAMP superfamily)